ncbi:MAG: tetratricopeptide repeat protein [Nitrososphaeraceae archaeon]
MENADAHYKKGRYSDAVISYNQAIKIKTNSHEVYLMQE